MTSVPGQFDASAHPRATDGKFAVKPHAEADLGALNLAAVPAVTPGRPIKALTPRDVEILVENKGCFADGYTPEDADKVLSRFESATLHVFWDYNDDYGLGGDSFFAGHPSGSQASGTFGEGRAVPYNPPFSEYRNIHPQAWEYLYDPDSDIDPERIPSLLEEEPAGINVGELYTFSIGMSEQYAFADETQHPCSNCGDPVYDSDTDALCTACEDLDTDHNDGDHDPATGGEADENCPQCKEGAGSGPAVDATVGVTVDAPVCEICADPTEDKDKHGTLMCQDCQDDADDEAEECAADGCDDDLSDNEGYDGYCGTHADKIENHSTGAHEPENDGPDDDCPTCNGA